MKKLCALAAFAFIGYICHYDIKYGTIPTATEAVQVSKAQPAETKAASSCWRLKILMRRSMRVPTSFRRATRLPPSPSPPGDSTACRRRGRLR